MKCNVTMTAHQKANLASHFSKDPRQSIIGSQSRQDQLELLISAVAGWLRAHLSRHVLCVCFCPLTCQGNTPTRYLTNADSCRRPITGKQQVSHLILGLCSTALSGDVIQRLQMGARLSPPRVERSTDK
jgi:hypothetical protein